MTISAQTKLRNYDRGDRIGRPPVMTPQQDAEARRLYALGYTPRAIADRFGKDVGAIRRRLGLKIDAPRTSPPHIPAKPVRMFISDWFTDMHGNRCRIVRGE